VRRFALLGLILAMASCGSGGNTVSVQSGPTSSVATSTTQTKSTTSSTARSTTTAAHPTTAQPATSAGRSGATCVNQDPSKSVPPIPKLPNAATSRHASYKFTVDYPSSWFDGTDMGTVTAGDVVDDTTLQKAGLKPADQLKNMNVAAKTNYPLLTVYRLPNVNDTADAVAARMATFLNARGVQTSPTKTWCLDRTPATGFLALATSGSLQESWFAIHDGALYYAFFIGKTDGTQQSQDALVLTFASIRATWQWT
jgi:hypothetical protein